MQSTLVIDTPLALAAHALAQLAAHPPDAAFLRVQLAATDAALDAFEATLAHPLAEVDAPAQRAYLAALVLACTLVALPAELAGGPSTAARMLELFERFVTPSDRALRVRLALGCRHAAGTPS